MAVFFALLAVLALLVYLVVHMPGRSHEGEPAPLSEGEAETLQRLRESVHRLSVEIGERHAQRPEALGAALDYFEAELSSFGYEVARLPYTIGVKEFVNLEAILQSDSDSAPILVIGGHYDSVPGTPGADDNATGAAAVLELARLLQGERLAHELRFVFFVNEEPPLFQTEHMGSLVYAGDLQRRELDVAGMLAVETIGYYDTREGSQAYPFPFSLFYPRTGDFIAFVGNLGSRSFVRRTVASFREHARFPSEGVAAPGFVPGIGWSDHWSFWKAGFPALMITDTAPFRNPHYHAATDVIETLDFEAMARVVHGLRATIVDLAGA
jgi:hypothetical protein